MSCNLDLKKQGQEVTFSMKLKKLSHPKIFFNDLPVVCAYQQKRLEMYLDVSLNFGYHIMGKMFKAMKKLNLIKKRNKLFPDILL